MRVRNSVRSWGERARQLGRLVVFVLALVASILPSIAPGQTTPSWDTGRLQITRAELEGLLRQLEEGARSPSYSEEFRKQSRLRAEMVQRRLREGDFQVGDQIQLLVERDSNAVVLAVGPGRILAIPNLGEVSLEGVLRSELNEKLRVHISRFIQDPVIQTRPMIRLAIIGSVVRSGFHILAAETPLPDAIMVGAGGLAPGAKLDNMRIQRGEERIWEGAQLRQAVAEGRTLDQMSLRSGDQIVVPGQAEGGMSRVTRVLTIVVPLAAAIAGILLR